MEHIRCNHLDSRRSKRPDKAIYIPKAMRAKPLKETQGECVETLSRFSLDSSGDISSLCTSKDSFAETDQRWKNSVNCQESDATSKTDQDVSSNCSNESLREQEAAPPPAKGIDNHWAPSLDQTVSYFMGMSIDDQQDDSESTTAEPAFRPPVPPREEWGDLTKEITAHLKETNVTIEVVRNDYSSYENVWVDPQEFGHVIEIYDFPTVLKTEDLLDAFAAFSEGGLKIKWVDNTHALGVFSSKSAALQALSIQHPLLKARILSEGTKKSKGKALRRAEFIQPVKERPRTDAVVARRMVTRALGLQKRMSRKPQD
ncbi:R3HC1 protein, partial [Amia calva]|nr:R3HC1 protein [Amia calva]